MLKLPYSLNDQILYYKNKYKILYNTFDMLMRVEAGDITKRITIRLTTKWKQP